MKRRRRLGDSQVRERQGPSARNLEQRMTVGEGEGEGEREREASGVVGRLGSRSLSLSLSACSLSLSLSLSFSVDQIRTYPSTQHVASLSAEGEREREVMGAE